MSKVRIYDLAHQMGVKPKKLVERIKEMGYDVKSHSSTLSEEDARVVLDRLEAEGWPTKNDTKETIEEEKASKPHVIVRRRREEAEEDTEEKVEEKPKEAAPSKKKIKLVIKKPVSKPVSEKKAEPEGAASEAVQKEAPEKEKALEGPSQKEEKEGAEKKELQEVERVAPQKTPQEAEKGPGPEAQKEEGPKEAAKTVKPKGPKVVARPVGVAKQVVDLQKAKADKKKEEDKTEAEKETKPHKGAKAKKPRRVVTEFEPRTKPQPPKPPVAEAEGKKRKKKAVVQIDEFRKKKARKKRERPKSEREQIREELELMQELEKFSESEEVVTQAETEEEKVVQEAKREEKKEKKTIVAPRKEKKIKVYESIQVGELAKQMGVKASEVIRKFMELGTMVTINQSIDAETAAIVASEFGYEVEQAAIEEEQLLEYTPPAPEELEPRPPVVTVMGHVDHGKTTLLDAIRETDVAAKEAGGITQHIGAYKVRLKNGQEITFIDTPGHEAFTHMRARGAQVTDIVILVVAADDGVMDQTKEAIDHARAAGVPIVVAINKIDKPDANPERVKSELAELGLVPEEWGGDVLYAEISAKKKVGIDELLELVLLQAEMLELKSAPKRPARGRIIESRLDKGRGPVATVIIQEGTLHEGDPFVAGTTYGRVRAMLDERGRRVKEAGPATPVETLGFSEVPKAGDDFIVMPDEQKARKVAEYRARKQREAETAREAKVSLEKLFEKLKEGEVKELKVVLKADVQGTLEALIDSLNKLSTDEVRVNIIRSGIGAISESDVMLAAASNAIIVGFNVRPTSQAKNLAEQEKIEIRFYDVIYKLIEDVKKAMSGLLEPEFEEKITGIAEVRATFKVPKVGVVAGCYVKEGKIERGAKVRLLRDNVVIYTGKIASLRRFKEDVKEVAAGYECGIGLENFQDIKVGDMLETFELVEIRREL